MISQNQFYGDNLIRAFPFQPGTVLDPRIFVDLALRITSASEALSDPGAVALVSLGGTSVRFDVLTGPMAGASFRGTIPVSPALYERVRLDFYNVAGVAAPGQGYGWVVLGDAAVPSGTYSELVEPTVLRYLEANNTVSFRLANAPCRGDTVEQESLGASSSFSFQGRTADTVARCVEIAVVPPAPVPQDHVSPDPEGTTVVPVPIPDPTQNVTTYRTGATTTVTTREIVVADALPAYPGYDAVPAGAAAIGADVAAGYNIKLTGSIRDGVLRVNYVLGAGLGPWCGAVPGCPPGVPSLLALKSINGVQGENLEFVRGAAIDVLPSPGDHTLYFVVHPEKLNRATA
ncbi:MAG TPA: hypothetical protein PLS53_00465 [Thermoanaerobaculaceae bacterium]|nr:hypothetical protein [Thermoanaerobaculaceae bacterium]